MASDSTWSVFKAKKSLRAKWDDVVHGGESSLEQENKALEAIKGKAGKEIRRDGVSGDFPADARTVDSVYYYPHLAHANLESQNCAAFFKDGKIEIWAPTQNPGSGIDAVAKALKIPKEFVTVHLTWIGGGFGRRLMVDYMLECAVIARQLHGKPVKVTWDREQDFQHDYYRSGGWHHLRGAVEETGKILRVGRSLRHLRPELRRPPGQWRGCRRR